MSKKNQRVIAEELARVGLKPHAIAGILANLEYENSFQTTLNNGDGGKASGIAQWHPDRFARVIRVAKKMGLKPTDIRAQARTLALSIKDENQSGSTGTTTVESLNGLKNAAAVAKFFDENYERSAGATRTQRMQAAKNYLKIAKRYSSGGTTSGEAVRKVPGSSNGTMTWVPKVGNKVSQDFTGPGNYKSGNHSGVDVPGGNGGQPIRWAPKVSGKVIGRGLEGGGGKNAQGTAYGNHVIIKDEKGRTWLLAHMAGEPPEIGTVLRQGDRIGRVGNTGNSRGAHLHIEMTAPGVDYRSGGPVKRARLVFKVGTDGQMYDKDFKPVDAKGSDYMDAVGLSGQALSRPGNEELKQLIDEAERKDWTTQEFTRRFKKTQWYIDRAGSQRQFDMMQDTEQQQAIKQGTAEAKALAAQLGIELDDEEARKLAIKRKRDGFTDEQAMWWLSKRFEYDPKEVQSGVAAAYEQSLKDDARVYGVRLSDQQIQGWIQEAIGRGVDIDTYTDAIREIAYEQNPYLRDAYDRGMTTADALAGKLAIAADVMGMEAQEFDLSDAKWREIFDANGNELTQQEWQNKLKTDQRYRYGWTKNALDEANNFGRNLFQVMGGMSSGI